MEQHVGQVMGCGVMAEKVPDRACATRHVSGAQLSSVALGKHCPDAPQGQFAVTSRFSYTPPSSS